MDDQFVTDKVHRSCECTRSSVTDDHYFNYSLLSKLPNAHLLATLITESTLIYSLIVVQGYDSSAKTVPIFVW